ncbi:MAG TPA: hypothetical protein VER58_20770 [Thermoanaerobaculia bacterium]|nr:hypothetical protein [Thermoanaerobaculia bacterium]
MKRSLCFFLFLASATAQAQLTTERAGTSQFLIAAAGAVIGANGTFFRSDITIINYRTDADQRIRFQWLPQGTSGTAVPAVELTLMKATGFSSEDFVTNVLMQSGLGSILVTALTADGQFDVAGKVHATARIWSNQPGLSSGTVSQTFPIIAINDINTPRLSILGQRRDDRYRTNVGIVNLDPQPQTFQVTVVADGLTEFVSVPVPGLSMQQVSLIGPPRNNLQLAVTNTTAGAQSLRWIAYGSSVDNVTGDSWSSLGYVVNQ